MISVDIEYICLFELIKKALFNEAPKIPVNVNWEKVLEIAKKHCIVPLLVSSVPEGHRNNWSNVLYLHKAHFMQMIFEQNSLISLFNDNNIPLVFLKGTSAATYYPNPILRTFGDIDFYIPEDLLDYSKDLLKENGYIFISNNVRQYVFNKNGIEFELHSEFSSKHYNNIEHIIKNGMNNAIEYRIAGYSFPGLPKYENGVVLLGHIMQHLKSSGIGLRQIIDWMLFVHNELDDMAWNMHFRSLAVEAGLEKLAITVTYMCEKWLGLPDKLTWCIDVDEELVDQLLLRILDDGNFGIDRAPYENVRRYIRSEGLFNHLQRYGIENWHLAQKYSLFRPVAWMYQSGRYVCQGIARVLKGEKVFRNNKPKLKLEELWKRLE